jgi:hypothetical protein
LNGHAFGALFGKVFPEVYFRSIKSKITGTGLQFPLHDPIAFNQVPGSRGVASVYLQNLARLPAPFLRRGTPAAGGVEQR